MAYYILRRILQVIPVFLGSTLLIYFMVFGLPGDPVASLFGDKQPPQAVIDALREQYKLNEPFIVQYANYLGGIFRLDFGTTFSGQSVNDVLARTVPVTMRLAVMSVAIAFVLALIIGALSAIWKGSIFDNGALTVRTRPGSTLYRTRSRRSSASRPSASRSRTSRPTSTPATTRRSMPSAPAGRRTTPVCTTSSARSTRPVQAPTTASTRTRSSTTCSPRASARRMRLRATPPSSRPSRSSSRTSPPFRSGTPTSTAVGPTA